MIPGDLNTGVCGGRIVENAFN